MTIYYPKKHHSFLLPQQLFMFEKSGSLAFYNPRYENTHQFVETGWDCFALRSAK